MLAHVQIVCFASCYAISLMLEVTRLFFRAPLRLAANVGFMLLGLFLHSVYLVMRSTPDTHLVMPLSSWFDWLLLLAWGMAIVYLVAAVRRPNTSLGIFTLPVVLILIGLASLFREVPPFPRGQALHVWGVIHGVALLLGSVGVMAGFVAGIMYLVQSYRLKRKLPPRAGMKLPSLEWLQRANKNSLFVSSGLLAAGLLSGVVLNLVKRSDAMPWTDPVVWTSGILFIWLIVVLIFESLNRAVRQGQRVVYLTLASFIFLGLVLVIVLLVPSEHAAATPDQTLPVTAPASVGLGGE